MDLVPYVLLLILSVLFLGPYGRATYDQPRRLLVALSGVGTLVWWGMYGTRVEVSSWLGWLVVGMLGWWFISCLLSEKPRSALMDFSVHVGMVISMFLLPFGELTIGLKLVMLGVMINCVYAITQSTFKHEIFKRSINYDRNSAIGCVGNQNMLGNYLTIWFFLSLYLAHESLWWLITSAIIAFSIYETHCRGSYLGLVAGSLYLWLSMDGSWVVYVVPPLGLGVAAVALLHKEKRRFMLTKETAYQRTKYWQIALQQLKTVPLFGLGFNVLQTRVPFIQRELNVAQEGKFFDPIKYSTPYPQKCHNDFLQTCVDVGIPGALMWVFLMTMAMLAPIDHTIKAALLSVLVSGLFLHNLHIVVVSSSLWFVAFLCLRAYGDVSLVSTPIYVFITTLAVLLVGVWLVIKRFVADLLLQRYFLSNGKNVGVLSKALKWWPNQGESAVFRSKILAANGRAWEALYDTLQQLFNYDGQIRIWELWGNAGKTLIMLGAPFPAETCAKEALSFNPHDPEALKLLKTCGDILLNGYKVHRTLGVVDDESKTNGTEHQGICTGVVDSGDKAAHQYKIQTSPGI